MERIRIKIGNIEHGYVIAVTTAPEEYDGFGTFTMCKLGPNEFNTDYEDRLILIPEKYLEWQRTRNESGTHTTFTEVEDCDYFEEDVAKHVSIKLFDRLLKT